MAMRGTQLLTIILLAILLVPKVQAEPVHKVAEDFEQIPWGPDQWNKAKGRMSLMAEAALT